ncbi:hypothetical protein [Aquimarina algicola]|uniref:Uncharacterized protein n=1 Tax=Aquimarina algicola TaxID=2589995 RepID=A0A504J3P6_9FLAO|nr:hypothetical protein [Aquimarina algicola]TPN80751.1 hypothetical protein FHK87_25960 [Aquimarina algicola]
MDNFLKLFNPTELTETIKKLAKKQLSDKIWIANGFELSSSRYDDLKYMILDEEKCRKYKNSFLIFAQATHSGSSYAFYKKPDAENCDEWPVIVMGDEGGCVVLAENIFGLMRFLTLNYVQPYINSLDYQDFNLFLDDEIDYDSEPSNEEYKKWIKKDFGLEVVLTIEQAKEEIITPAINKYQSILNPIFEI